MDFQYIPPCTSTRFRQANLRKSSSDTALINKSTCSPSADSGKASDLTKVSSLTLAASDSATNPPSLVTRKIHVSEAINTHHPSPAAFDFLFIDSTNQVRQTLIDLTANKHQEVVLSSHPNDLSNDNLTHRLQILDNGQTDLKAGKLFDNEAPITLVLDIRSLTAKELPKFNDLLDPDSPSLYDKTIDQKRPLGSHVSLLILADSQQLIQAQHNTEAPGADFWRRINRPDNTWKTDQKITDDVSTLLPEYSDNSVNSQESIIIDCHLHPDWRRLLFGGPGIDDLGKIRHIPGKLQTLLPGQHVILKGADWADLIFEQAIRSLIARNQYVSNGIQRSLPEGVKFYRAEVAAQELGQMLQGLETTLTPDKPVVVNRLNLSEWLNDITINEHGHAEKNTALRDQIRAGSTITVTSPLSKDAWFRLLGALHNIQQETSLTPKLLILHTKGQPESLQPETNQTFIKQTCSELCQIEGVKVVTYQQSAQADLWLANNSSYPLAETTPQKKPLILHVNAHTSLNQLFDNIHILSEKNARFGRQQTPLQAALQTGRPVVIKGLETNPALQQLLEPICCGQPLLINGCLQSFPKASITLLWPHAIKCSSPLWSQLLLTASQCPELDIWEHAANRHKIPRASLPEQAINHIYQAFNTIPDNLKPAPGQLPVLSGELLHNLIQAAYRARQVDQVENLEPRHWRKAINSVFTHCTRQNPTVRDFMKFACEQLLPDDNPSLWVDPERLSCILDDCQTLNREALEKQIWSLARAFHPEVFKKGGIKGFELTFCSPIPHASFQNERWDALCALIAAHAGKHSNRVARQLKVDPEKMTDYQGLIPKPGTRIKRLEDALCSDWSIQPEAQSSRSVRINQLAATCFDIASRTSEDHKTQKALIKQELSQNLTWAGSKTHSLDDRDELDALAEDLYQGHISQTDRERRRLHHLKSRLATSPAIFLQGETGAGKSYFSAKVAREAGPVFIVSVGPSTSEQSLVQCWAWREGEDNDRCLKHQQQIMLQWAETVPSDDVDYCTLVIDEGNLPPPELLTILKGLWQNPPCIYVGGHPVKVTEKHRVILTGNPDQYSGRQLDPELQSLMQQVHYPSLSHAFLRDRVVEPALGRHLLKHVTTGHVTTGKADALADQATRSMLTLWPLYQELLPDHEFTPRDLTDICAWVGWYLNQTLTEPQEGQTPEIITPGQINALILQGFRDVMGFELRDNQKPRLAALENWFTARHPVDNTLVKQLTDHTMKLTSNYFRFETSIHKPEFDTSATAISELVTQLGQDLSRCQQAWYSNVSHGGRQATLIEGPAGRGKDVTLKLLINSFTRQIADQGQSIPPVTFLNACDCSWESLCSAIAQAKINGGILVISEMNRIDSQHLEGELNDILAGNAHPGFHLFATVNPPQYSGRKPLSPALKGRFRHIPIREYNQDELTAIARKALPDNPEGNNTAIHLTDWHCRLRRKLHQNNCPMHPTSLELQRLAAEIALSGDYSVPSLRQHASRHYWLYLMAAECDLTDLTDKEVELAACNLPPVPADHALCQSFHKTAPVNHPWLIIRGKDSYIASDRHLVTVPDHLDEKAAQLQLIKSIADAKWQESWLSTDLNGTEDPLTQALYRRWQHQWFERFFSGTGVNADDVFPLTETQALALDSEENRQHRQTADRLVTPEILDTANLWPPVWASLMEMICKTGSDKPEQPIVSPSTPTPSTSAPEGKPEESTSVQQDINKRESEHQRPTARWKKNMLALGFITLSPVIGAGLLGRGIYRGLKKLRQCERGGATLDAQNPKNGQSPLNIKLQSTNTWKLNKHTDYHYRQKRTIISKKIFNSHHDDALYRLRIDDLRVHTNGDVEFIRVEKGRYGFEDNIHLATWPKQSEILLTSEQIIASVTIETTGDWLYLPSLYPDETITALRTEPTTRFNIKKDRYTGQHLIKFPELTGTQQVKIDFIVEKNRAGAAPDLQHNKTDQDVNCPDGIRKVLNKLFDTKNQSDMPKEQQQQLQLINSASNQIERISAIAQYCQQFTGTSKTAPGTNFFEFLVKSQQGACAHRTVVFVALCLHHGIRAKCVSNASHMFPEYLDSSNTWKLKDLGGAPTNIIVEEAEFPPTKREIRLPQQHFQVLKTASPSQRGAYARALSGLSTEDIDSLINGRPAFLLPSQYAVLTNESIIMQLLRTNDASSFLLGIDLLTDLTDSKTLNKTEETLLCNLNQNNLRKAIILSLLSDNHDQQSVRDNLHKLHKVHRFINRNHDRFSQSWQSHLVSTLHLFFSKDIKALLMYNEEFTNDYRKVESSLQRSFSGRRQGFSQYRPDPIDIDRIFEKYCRRFKINPSVHKEEHELDNILGGLESSIKELYNKYEDYKYKWERENGWGWSRENGWGSRRKRDWEWGWYDTVRDICGRHIENIFQKHFAKYVAPLEKSLPSGNVLAAAYHALDSGWLNPESQQSSMELHELLKCMKNFVDLAPLATASLQKWYDHRLQTGMLGTAIADADNIPPNVFHDYGGKSDYLESTIAVHGLSQTWTDEPGGAPDIGRLLTRNPAFPILGYENNTHRPMVVTGIPHTTDWTGCVSKNIKLYEQIQASTQEKKEALCNAFRMALCHYLFRLTHSNGGQLVFAFKDEIKINSERRVYGSYIPKSPEDLYRVMSFQHYSSNDKSEYPHLVKACNVHNGVIFNYPEIERICAEFAETADIASLWKEIQQHPEFLDT